MTGKTLKLQQIVIDSLKNIDLFNGIRVNVYTSIPSKRHIPYIKIYGLSLNKNNNSCSIKTFTIDLFVATNWKDNKEIIEIMETINENIALQIEKTATAQTNNSINIYNVYNNHYNIAEDLQNGIWYGHFYVDIDVI